MSSRNVEVVLRIHGIVSIRSDLPGLGSERDETRTDLTHRRNKHPTLEAPLLCTKDPKCNKRAAKPERLLEKSSASASCHSFRADKSRVYRIVFIFDTGDRHTFKSFRRFGILNL